ncbi:MarR family transcriptional regulator [Allopontixanthobacter sediminis]|uniref:MarR family transcriptional regulator n=1 Tax=Allopontixanthobacter sediminis TaxID=1689985 RepID=A0A845B558_9SPHN|nr:MarR family transcriptional regulator [Allopontixanthobacter sediminis]MXP44567.1 MarR family transcriptional regulator [Allopontixanthobacter sediminis]
MNKFGNEGPDRLREMAFELIAMADSLEKSNSSAFRFGRARPTDSEYMSKPHLAQQAEEEYRLRRARIPGLQEIILGEPAWDILLDLYVQQAKGRLVSISSACIASTAPMTTALRHLKLLESHGLVLSSRASHDDRVRMVELSPEGQNLMTGYLSRRAKVSKVASPSSQVDVLGH